MTAERSPATAPARAVRGRNGAVASPHHLATEAGIAALRSGGSAVDAAIATNAALAVVAGHSCGLGGDAFWLVWDPDRSEVVALNGSGRSGSGATIEAAHAAGHTEMPQRGPWSVTVPGAIDSWGKAHERFGRLDWPTLLAPATDLAGGFPASPGWLSALEQATAALGDGGDWARVYLSAERAQAPGATVRLPALERTLRTLAAEGPATAYSGTIAGHTAAYFTRRGVPIVSGDLQAHTSDWVSPISTSYRGVTSVSHPPNSVGVVALQTLGMLERFDAPAASDFDGHGWGDADWVHLGLEASRVAFVERDAHVTDAAHMPADAVAEMLSTELLDALAALIDPTRTMPPRPGSLPAGGGTVYITAADRWGGLASLLESNYQGFGSGLVDPETGIAFQDRGAFFRLDAAHPNSLAPGKRTAHTLAPGMLLRDGRPWMAHGSMGGEIQPQIFTQFVSAVVDGRVDVATAVAAPRWAALKRERHGPPDLSQLEARVPEDLARELQSRGHDVAVTEPWSSAMGHAHAIEVTHDSKGSVESYAAAADPRCEGLAATW